MHWKHSKKSQEFAVRINSVGSGFELDDLDAILKSKKLDALVLPKVESKNDIQLVCKKIDAISPKPGEIKLVASIESAKGLENIHEIAKADERVDALLFAAEDYCADLGLVRTPSRLEMLYARQKIINTARVYSLQSIDMVCVDYQNDQVLIEECVEGRQWGFSGKQAIHPKQVDIVQQTFMPSEQEVERAEKILDGAKDHAGKGVGAFSLDGKMIDAPVIKWAEKIVARSKR